MKTSPTSQSAIPFPRALQDSGILRHGSNELDS